MEILFKTSFIITIMSSLCFNGLRSGSDLQVLLLLLSIRFYCTGHLWLFYLPDELTVFSFWGTEMKTEHGLVNGFGTQWEARKFQVLLVVW